MSKHPGGSKPYEARLWRGGKKVNLGYFATAEEAALCIARSPEGKAVAERAAAAPPLTSEEALEQAQAEGLTLLARRSGSGYFGVQLANPGSPKPYLSVGVPRDVGCCALVVFAAYIFSVQFSSALDGKPSGVLV